MSISEEQRRHSFSVWLRTGRRPRLGDGRDLELKFNPWHDPDDGRFTFSGTGRYFDRGTRAKQDSGRRQAAHRVQYVEDRRLPPISSFEELEAWKAAQIAEHGGKPGYREAIEIQYRRYHNTLAGRSPDRASADRRGTNGPTELPTGDLSGQGGISAGGGSFGGGGASGSWDAPGGISGGGGASASWAAPTQPDHSGSAAAAQSANNQRYTVVRNGYTYEIDARGRTRRVSGVLSDTETIVRSATNQAKAGGEDRRVSDDGGHYIAARFDGPTDAFNHFAQDSNFNRGRYRVLEDQWAKAKRMGKEVTVTIVPYYHAGSLRPFEIDVSFTINGHKESIKMPNEKTEKTEKTRGKR